MILICVFTITVLMMFLQTMQIREYFIDLYQGAKSKCYACERELPDGYKWLGQPTKSFDSERALANTQPYLGAYGGKTSCYACQKQFADQYLTRHDPTYDPNASWRFPGSYVIWLYTNLIFSGIHSHPSGFWTPFILATLLYNCFAAQSKANAAIRASGYIPRTCCLPSNTIDEKTLLRLRYTPLYPVSPDAALLCPFPPKVFSIKDASRLSSLGPRWSTLWHF